jgi:hypothetical protein
MTEDRVSGVERQTAVYRRDGEAQRKYILRLSVSAVNVFRLKFQYNDITFL